MSSSKSKKDKGKTIKRAEDYQLTIPTQNQFQPLVQTQFPPLPYKNAITNPSSSNSVEAYMVRHTEHLLLTRCKPPAPTNIISEIVQKSFGTNQFATDDLRKTQKFYELILVDTNSVSLTHTFDKYHQHKFCIPNALSKQSLPLNNAKIRLKSAPFPFPFPHKNIIIMITKLRGIVHSFFNQMFIHGSLISMNNVQILFPFGFSIGGQCLVCLLYTSDAADE